MENKIIDFQQARRRHAGGVGRPPIAEFEWQEATIPLAPPAEIKIVY